MEEEVTGIIILAALTLAAALHVAFLERKQ
jgi:hypothetical protein